MSEDTQSPSGGDNYASSDSAAVEWLATGRSKRATAGNRLSTLIGQEEEGEDDVNLLFEQESDVPDEEFEDEDASDEGGGDSSSSDEEDDQAGDELEGEKQLRKEERENKKAQKRKADQKFFRPPPPRKRVRISAASPQDEAGSPKTDRMRKRSERTSMIVNLDDRQVRASSRPLAIQNKERTQANLKKSEAKRSKQLAVMEAAQKKRDAEKKGPMTQEDRLKEAAEVERQNSKSLNKWEEMEAERIKKQKEKLDALQNRKIEGPMIRWWSGPAEWVGDKLIHVGAGERIEPLSATTKNSKITKQDKPSKNESNDLLMVDRTRPTTSSTDSPAQGGAHQQILPSASSAAHTQQSPPKSAVPFLDGIEQFASMPEPTPTSQPPASNPSSGTVGSLMTPYPMQPPTQTQLTPLQQFRAGAPITAAMAPPPPPPPAPPVKGLRSVVILENFDTVVERSQDAQARIIFGLRSSEEARSVKQQPPTLCAITSQRAKYKDPLTGLPYLGRAEFRKIRNLPGLEDHQHRGNSGKDKAKWSDVLGAWIGIKGQAAKGVPESFLSGNVPLAERTEPLAVSDAAHIKPETETNSVR